MMRWLRLGRSRLLAAAVGSAVVAVAAIVASALTRDLAWVVLAAVLVLGLTAVLLAKSLHNRVGEAETRIREEVRSSAKATASASRYAPGKPLDMLRRDLQRDMNATAILASAVPSTHRMPPPGGWAATPDTLLGLVEIVLSAGRPLTVVEAGSGTSTAWIAAAMRRAGHGGRIVSLEHEARFAALTSARLADLGLADLVDLRIAPLVAAGDGALWYDQAAIAGLAGIDLLFVDGPPGSGGPMARKPAFPLLRGALAPGAWVVLDDLHRPDEQAILAGWLASADGALVERYRTDRAVFLQLAS